MRIIPNNGRDEWLEQRQKVITATDISRLHRGGPDTWARIREEKEKGVQKFGGNAATQWGKQREGFIADYVAVFVDSRLVHNECLVVSDQDTRFAATPDMLCPETLAELKTTNKDFTEVPYGYMLQLQWQLLVTGCESAIFAWETHENYVPGDIKHMIVLPDKEMQAALVETALRFLEGDAPDSDPGALEWRELIEAYADAARELEQAKAKVDDIKEQMRERAGGHDTKFSADFGSVTIFTPKPAARFDSARFKKEHPELAAEYTARAKATTQQVKVTLPKPKEETDE